MRAVVLAAGDGGRLGAHTASIPKPLVRIGGRTIVDYTFESLAAAGVDEAVVVTGYREGQICDAIGDGGTHGVRVRLVSNPRYHRGASYSLASARPYCGNEPFLLVMSDHLLSAPLLASLLARRTGEPGKRGNGASSLLPPPFSLIAADFHPREQAYTAEATKLAVLRTEDSVLRVTAIGKGVEGWSALDAGAFWCTPDVWDAAGAVAEDCELSTIFGELARRGRLFAADVSGSFWYDVDTEDDLEAAGRLVARNGETENRRTGEPVRRHSVSPFPRFPVSAEAAG